MSVFEMWTRVEKFFFFLVCDQSVSRKSYSFPSSFPSFLTHPVAVGCLTSPGSILKKTFVNANGCLVFSQGLSLYKETYWYAFLCKIPQMLWGTSRIRANNPGLPRMKGIRYKTFKPSSQSNCLCGLWMLFFFNALVNGVLKLLKCCMWSGRFCSWIDYEPNDRHAACVANVSVCATGRFPERAAQSLCH